VGLFDFLSRDATVPAPQLKKALLDAIEGSNDKLLRRLCRSNADEIIKQFPDWQKLPKELHNNVPATNRYITAMIAIAECMRDHVGRSEPYERLHGGPEPASEDELAQARMLLDEMRYPEAADLLEKTLIETGKTNDPGTEVVRAFVLGYLGECRFHMGQAERAVDPFRQALAVWEKVKQAEAAQAYLLNLFEVYRYLGQGPEAAGCMDRLVSMLPSERSRRYRKVASIVRAGEPLNRVVVSIDDQIYELDELPEIRNTQVRFLFLRNRLTLQPASEATRRGESLGSQGQFDAALEALRHAAQYDAYDPHSRYLQGLTLLELRRYDAAVESFAVAERLAPGWFNVRADQWIAQQLAQGVVAHEIFQALRVVEDSTAPPKDKIQIAEAALAKAPNFSPLLLLLGKNLMASDRRQDAVLAFKRGLESAGEPDVKTRLLLELGAAIGSRDLLVQAAELNGHVMSAAMARVALRANR
jgi:tetratricopeptide (TPR) repeat protein